MPQRKIGKIEHIKYAKNNFNQRRNIKIQVAPANLEIIKFWETYIQKNYIDGTGAVDDGWSWLINYCFKQPLANAARQDPKTLCIYLTYEGKFIPLGLVFLVNKYPALNNTNKNSTFIWYLTTAPKDYINDILPESLRPSLGKLSLEIALTESYINKNEGRLGLHADPKGKEKLVDFYTDACLLSNFPKDKGLPTYLRSKFAPNDGRYFFYTDENAFEFSKSLDYLRP